MAKLPQILTDFGSQLGRYKEPLEFQRLQQHSFWTFDEVDVSKDVQYIFTVVDENSKHGILETLKLFTIYETKADSFWSNVKEMFPDPDIKAMAALFSGVEASVHRNAYKLLNELMNKHDDDFYNEYKQSDFLVERMNFIDDCLENGSKLEQLASLCFAEGVILFSNFAFLMSFRANGDKLLPNVGNVIKFSSSDEDYHNKASSWLFRTLNNELTELGQEDPDIKDKVIKMANVVKEHEFKIIESIFSKGPIPTITEEELKTFILTRIDICLTRMGFDPMYNIKNDVVAKWFDEIMTRQQNNDFFDGQGSGYSRGWKKSDYIWKGLK